MLSEITKRNKTSYPNKKCHIFSFMKHKITVIKQGTVTSPKGFLEGATEAAVKYKGCLDLGILYLEKPCTTVAVFTKNKVKAAHIFVSLKSQANFN
jgi:N-acetylglutamate synthase/N-acetylornithine aminotransferase